MNFEGDVTPEVLKSFMKQQADYRAAEQRHAEELKRYQEFEVDYAEAEDMFANGLKHGEHVLPFSSREHVDAVLSAYRNRITPRQMALLARIEDLLSLRGESAQRADGNAARADSAKGKEVVIPKAGAPKKPASGDISLQAIMAEEGFSMEDFRRDPTRLFQPIKK